MRKLLFIIDSLNCGGAEKSLISLFSVLDFSSYNVDLMLFKRGGSLERYLPKYVNIVSPPKLLLFLSKQRLFLNANKKLIYTIYKYHMSFNLRLYKKRLHPAQIIWKTVNGAIEVNNKEYDVAIAYSQGLPTYYLTSKVSASKKIAWINTDSYKAGYNKKFELKYYHFLNNVVVVSDTLKTIIKQFMPEIENKITKIADIINPKLVESLSEGENPFNDNYNGFRLLTIGRLVPIKGYEIALKACNLLKNEGYKFKWYIIGEGSYRSIIEKEIKKYELADYFILLGEITNPYKYIKNSDIYVQTSKFEGFGLSVAEAKILEKPIISTNFSLIYEHIENDLTGLIVEYDEYSLFYAIKRLIDSEEIRNNFSCNISKSSKYDSTSEVSKFYKLLN